MASVYSAHKSPQGSTRRCRRRGGPWRVRAGHRCGEEGAADTKKKGIEVKHKTGQRGYRRALGWRLLASDDQGRRWEV